MNLYEAKIILDVHLYQAVGVSKETGRKRLEILRAKGVVTPLRTPTGRTLLSFHDSHALENALRPDAAAA